LTFEGRFELATPPGAMLSWLLPGLAAPEPASPDASTNTTASRPNDANSPSNPDEDNSPFATAGATFMALSKGRRAGYGAFVHKQAKVIKAYSIIRDEQAALRFLSRHVQLMTDVGHVRQWFFERHLTLIGKLGYANEVDDEAAAYFLLDAAAHAARQFLARNPEHVVASAHEGIRMLEAAVRAPGDPVGVNACIAERVAAWMGMVQQRIGSKANSPPPKPGAASPEHGETTPRWHGKSLGNEPPQPTSPAKGDRPSGKKKVARKGSSGDPARVLKPLGYEPLGPIAAGAFSTILRCKEASSGREVAIKSFDSAKCAKDPALGFARDNEMHVLRQLQRAAKHSAEGGGQPAGTPHPHIANMLVELGDIDGPHLHAVLEYCEGG
jgi:hypothetical protein